MDDATTPNATPADEAASPSPQPLARQQTFGEQVLDGWLEDTDRAIQALQGLRLYLKEWRQRTGHVPLADFEHVQDILRDANLSAWAQEGWFELRQIVTGQTTR